MPAPKRRGRPRKDEAAARASTAKSTAKTASKSTSGRKRSTASAAKKTLKPQGNIIFALDIGTRTVVGVLGYAGLRSVLSRFVLSRKLGGAARYVRAVDVPYR